MFIIPLIRSGTVTPILAAFFLKGISARISYGPETE